MSQNAKEWIIDISAAVLCAAIILFFFRPTIVNQTSMLETLQEKDYLFVSQQQYKLLGKEPQRGDIIVFNSSLEDGKGKNKKLIKRIIAVGGDTISITGGLVYLNGEALDEPYTKDGYTAGEMEEVTVPEGCLFCMGDNRQVSADSRDSRIGMVSMDQVVGKAIFRLFPLKSMGGLYK